MSAPNLILTGFMGTGKSSVSAIVAERLNRRFIDVDQWIESHVGKTVARIFAEDGEERFRQWEAEACVALSEMRDCVITTGGWTLGSSRNRDMLQRNGRVICLTASVDAILQRLDDAHDRPLLAETDRVTKVQSLLNERESVYRSFAWQVDTTQLSIDEAAQCITNLWRTIAHIDEPNTFYLPFPAHDAASILLGSNLVPVLGALLFARGLRGKIGLVSDAHVSALHGERVADTLRSAGFEVVYVDIPAGEANKTLDTVQKIYEAVVAGGLDRGDCVVALGGGMVSDLAGFAAATYMRGVPWVCVPTSLLGLIDASVGGKVGVDLAAGKNLVGAFHPAQITIGDLDLLATLPEVELCAGMAEAIKAAVIDDVELFELLEQGDVELREIARRALRVKIDIVRDDPFEKGQRAALNLGHTIGHGIEAASGYALRHGEAIAIGLIGEALLAECIGLAHEGLSTRIESVLKHSGLPSRHQLDVDTIWLKMQSDKKKRQGRLKFALPRDIGDVVTGVDVDDQIVHEVLIALRE